AAGDQAAYRVAAFNEPDPPADAAAKVSWLVRADSGAALTHVARGGPELRVTVPQAWAGQTVLVMPYMNSPSTAVSVATRIAPLQSNGTTSRERAVKVIQESRRYYASVDDEPRFYLGTDVRYGGRRGLTNANNPPGP